MIFYKWNLTNKTSEQNIARNSETKNKLTVTGGQGVGDKGGGSGKVITCIQDTWTKLKGGRTKGRRCRCVGRGEW